MPEENENGKRMIYEYSHKHISTWADSIVLFLKIKLGHKVMIYDKNYHINALAEVKKICLSPIGNNDGCETLEITTKVGKIIHSDN